MLWTMPGRKTNCQMMVLPQSRSCLFVTAGCVTGPAVADIPLPEGLMPPVDETDDLREELETQNKGPDRWVELGLHTVH